MVEGLGSKAFLGAIAPFSQKYRLFLPASVGWLDEVREVAAQLTSL
jgi:hypothetical protein